ncbi:MAG TPA: hypothetical protein VFR78_14470 [Pyrinomonadaceae bacterium]|nr:hypothetical protein [Pyrinomonadaceae bacterium]
MKKKKTATIIILIVWFIWSTGTDLNALIRPTATTDFYIFSSNNLAPLLFFFAITVFLLDAATVWFLFSPRPAGFYIALSALGLSLIQSVVSVSLAVTDLSGVRQAYVVGRRARGLSVTRPEALDMMFTPGVMYAILTVLLLITALIAFLIVWNRAYFFSNNITSTAPSSS